MFCYFQRTTLVNSLPESPPMSLLTWLRICGAVVLLFNCAQLGLSQEPTKYFYNSRCRRLTLGGDEKQLVKRIEESLAAKYKIKLVPWPENAPGHRLIDILAPDDNPEQPDFQMGFGTVNEKARASFASTNAGPMVIFPAQLGPYTLPEPKRTWLIEVASITVSHYTGLSESTVSPELDKLLKSAEAIDLKESDIEKSAMGKGRNRPVFESSFGAFTVVANRDWGAASFTVYRFSCK
jgi:hypothetical protein